MSIITSLGRGAERPAFYKETFRTMNPAELRHIFRRARRKSANRLTEHMKPSERSGENRREATCCTSALYSRSV